MNKAENTLDNRFIKITSKIKRDILDARSKQLNSGDALLVEVIETVTTFALVENTQNTQLVSVPETAVDASPFYTDFGFLLYVNNDGNPNYLWPNGSALIGIYGTGNPISVHWRRDLVASNDSIGKRVFLFYLLYRAQYVLPPITAYLHTKLYTPKRLFA